MKVRSGGQRSAGCGKSGLGLRHYQAEGARGGPGQLNVSKKTGTFPVTRKTSREGNIPSRAHVCKKKRGAVAWERVVIRGSKLLNRVNREQTGQQQDPEERGNAVLKGKGNWVTRGKTDEGDVGEGAPRASPREDLRTKGRPGHPRLRARSFAPR